MLLFKLLKAAFAAPIVALCLQTPALAITDTQTVPHSVLNENTSVQTTGDGYAPIPFNGDRFFYMNHHTPLNLPPRKNFGCIEKDTGSGVCAGFGDPTSTPGLYTMPLPDGDPNTTLNTTTASANEEFVILSNRYLLYPVTRFSQNFYNQGNISQDWGMGCYDLISNVECGYTQLSANPDSRALKVAIEGPYRVGNKLYLLDLAMTLHCVEIVNAQSAQMSACSTATLDLHAHSQTKIPAFHTDTDSQAGHIGAEIVGSKLYLTATVHGGLDFPAGTTFVSGDKVAICVETASNAMTVCPPPWPGSVAFVTRDRHDNLSNYIAFDPQMSPESLCLMGTNVHNCIDLVTGADTTLNYPTPNSGALVPHGFGKEITLGTKTYLPNWAANSIHCLDWSNGGQPCQGWTPTSLDWAHTQMYGLEKDNANCVWALGHNNNLWSLNPFLQSTPCDLGYFEHSVTACENVSWSSLNVINVDLSDYDAFDIEIYDTNGVITSFDMLANPSVSLANLGNMGGTLNYRAVFDFAQGVTEFTSQPNITVTADESACVTVVDPCDDGPYTYDVKMICGIHNGKEELGYSLLRGKYSTIVNLKSQCADTGEISKMFYMALPPGYQKPGDVFELSGHETYPNAFAVDCNDLFEQSPKLRDYVDSGLFFEGFLELKSKHPLTISSVYTAGDLEGQFSPSLHIENAITQTK